MAVDGRRALCHGADEPVNAMRRWAEVIDADSRVLVIVNSSPSRLDEIALTITAIGASTDLSRVSCIAPTSLRSWLIGFGLSGANILPARLQGADLDLVYFLETPRALRWVARGRPNIVIGTEPYALNNTEVKDAFELHAAALVGEATFVAHSLPDQNVFCFDVKELWLRVARQDSMSQHHARVQSGMALFERAWKDGAAPDSRLVSEQMVGRDIDPNQPAIVDASRRTCARLQRALDDTGVRWHGDVRVLVNPIGYWPARGWLAGIEPVARPQLLAPGVRWHKTRLVKRGLVDQADSRLLQSRPLQLKAGDAVIAEGHVYDGGISIGLLSGTQWVARVDVDDPGEFMAAVVAGGVGPQTLVIASCLKGENRRVAVALHQFGWARRTR